MLCFSDCLQQEGKATPRAGSQVPEASTSLGTRMPKLSNRGDSAKFSEVFSVPDISFSQPRIKLAKSFLKKNIPEWLHELGKAFARNTNDPKSSSNKYLLIPWLKPFCEIHKAAKENSQELTIKGKHHIWSSSTL